MSVSRSTPASMDDLEKLSRVDGASPIESIDEPGGGKRVRLTDPDGFQVEVVHGMQQLPKIPVARPAVNSGEDKTRRRNAPLSGRARSEPHQAHRPFRRDEPEFREDARLVPRDAGLSLFGRGLRRSEDQYRRLVQPARPRRRLCRSPRVLLHPRRQSGLEPPVLRGRRYRRRHGRPRAHAGKGLRAFLGHRPPFARQPGVRLLGRPLGPGARALGRYRRLERQRAAEPVRRAARSTARGAIRSRPASWATRCGSEPTGLRCGGIP